MKKFRRILVAVDGSEQSELALNKAIQVAKRNQAQLYVAHVIDMRAFETITSYDTSLAQIASNEAYGTLGEYIEQALHAGLANVKSIVEFGIPKNVIARELQQKYDIDLIILGATGLSSIERFMMGSVSSYVSRHAHCDVLIVRTPEKNNEKKY